MKFHEWKATPRYIPIVKTSDEMSQELLKLSDQIKSSNLADADKQLQIAYGSGMLAWKFDHRPYYSVYPSIVKSLIKTKLDAPVYMLDYPTKTGSLLIRLAKGHELDGIISAIFVCPAGIASSAENRRMIHLVNQRLDGNIEVLLVLCDAQETIESAITKNEEGINYINTSPKMCLEEEWKTHTNAAMRLALGIALLDPDPELIVPDVLESDKNKLDSTIDPEVVARLADKARRRGKVGWIIGECTDEKEGVKCLLTIVAVTGASVGLVQENAD